MPRSCEKYTDAKEEFEERKKIIKDENEFYTYKIEKIRKHREKAYKKSSKNYMKRGQLS